MLFPGMITGIFRAESALNLRRSINRLLSPIVSTGLQNNGTGPSPHETMRVNDSVPTPTPRVFFGTNFTPKAYPGDDRSS
jgi:hypothetical protein